MDSFMSNIKSAASSAVTGGEEKKPNPDHQSNADLMSSAKLVAEAAQCAASNQSDKIDKPKVAGAAADLLDAAKQYGKFDENQGVGQYLKQADDYLHKYENSGTTAKPPAESAPAPAEEEKRHEAAPEKGGKEESESGFGASDAFKAAGSFFK